MGKPQAAAWAAARWGRGLREPPGRGALGQPGRRRLRYGGGLCPACTLGGEGPTKERGVCQHFCLGGSCPPALALQPDTSAPPVCPRHPQLRPRRRGGRASRSAVSLRAGLLNGAWDSRRPASRSATISAGFHSHQSRGLLSLALEPGAGSPVWGRDPEPRNPSRFLTAARGCGTSRFRVSAPCPVSLWPLPCVPSCRASVQPDFGWFAMVALSVSCDFHTVMRGGEHHVYLLRHLDRKSET